MASGKRWVGAAGGAFCLVALTVVGCQKPEASGVEKQVADGKAVFTKNCANCHAVNGQGGGSGPDLSKTAASHEAKWLMEHIDNPKVHNPGSRMPAFGEKLGDKPMQDIIAYVLTLK